MTGYSNILRRTSVAVTTTPIKLFDPPTPNRIGWRVFVPTSVPVTVGIRFLIRPVGGTAPTLADLLAGASFRADPGSLVQDGARSGLEVWVAIEAGSTALLPEEILS